MYQWSRCRCLRGLQPGEKPSGDLPILLYKRMAAFLGKNFSELWTAVNKAARWKEIERQEEYLTNRNYNYSDKNKRDVDKLIKILIVLTGFRNVCAHEERLYCYHTKHDLFAVVISMRYLLPDDWFLSFKKELIKIIERYTKNNFCFTENKFLKFMGFPENWKDIGDVKK